MKFCCVLSVWRKRLLDHPNIFTARSRHLKNHTVRLGGHASHKENNSEDLHVSSDFPVRLYGNSGEQFNSASCPAGNTGACIKPDLTTGKKKRARPYAVALAVLLAVLTAGGGTLMLFTDTSETSTNVMVAGSAKIGLFEQVDDNDDGVLDSSDALIDASDSANGADLGTIRPGDTILKKPWVSNKGDTDVYVAIEVIFYSDDDAWMKRQEQQLVLPGEFLLNLDYNRFNWLCTDFNPIDNGEKWQAIYYYVDNGGNPAILSATKSPSGEDAVTPALFEQIDIPAYWDNDIHGDKFKLEIKAYAVQSDNTRITSVAGSGELQSLFHDQFNHIPGYV